VSFVFSPSCRKICCCASCRRRESRDDPTSTPYIPSAKGISKHHNSNVLMDQYQQHYMDIQSSPVRSSAPSPNNELRMKKLLLSPNNPPKHLSNSSSGKNRSISSSPVNVTTHDSVPSSINAATDDSASLAALTQIAMMGENSTPTTSSSAKSSLPGASSSSAYAASLLTPRLGPKSSGMAHTPISTTVSSSTILSSPSTSIISTSSSSASSSSHTPDSTPTNDQSSDSASHDSREEEENNASKADVNLTDLNNYIPSSSFPFFYLLSQLPVVQQSVRDILHQNPTLKNGEKIKKVDEIFAMYAEKVKNNEITLQL